MATTSNAAMRPLRPAIVIVWFGLTELGKWFPVFWGVFFTVWLSVHLGVQRVNETLIRAARCLGATRKMMLFEVMLPGALPYIWNGAFSPAEVVREAFRMDRIGGRTACGAHSVPPRRPILAIRAHERPDRTDRLFVVRLTPV